MFIDQRREGGFGDGRIGVEVEAEVGVREWRMSRQRWRQRSRARAGSMFTREEIAASPYLTVMNSGARWLGFGARFVGLLAHNYRRWWLGLGFQAPLPALSAPQRGTLGGPHWHLGRRRLRALSRD